MQSDIVYFISKIFSFNYKIIFLHNKNNASYLHPAYKTLQMQVFLFQDLLHINNNAPNFFSAATATYTCMYSHFSFD